MKFHCDRCKTRYSIADDRVRGKILKIRCKNCSAVITVKEGMSDVAEARNVAAGVQVAVAAGAGAPMAAGSALQGAFQRAMSRPSTEVPAPRTISPSDSFRAPVHIAEEWYLSFDGEQFGPFALDAAKEWVLSRSPDEELFCWQEDFDDWLPADKVSHFRGLRTRIEARAAAPGRLATVTPPPLPPAPPPARARSQPVPLAELARAPINEETPKPLFDAAMKKLEAQARAASEAGEEEVDPFAALARGRTEPDRPAKSNGEHRALFDKIDAERPPGDDLDFDIGEASRIVKLPMLAAAARDAAGAGAANPAEPAADGALPGVAKIPAGGVAARVGRGSGAEAAVRAPLAPLSDTALADAQPPILSQSTVPPRRSPLLMPLLIGGGVVVVMLGVLLVVLLGGGDSEAGLARSDVGGGELGGRDFRLGGGSGDEEDEEGAAATADPTRASRQIRRTTPRNGTGDSAGQSGTPAVVGPIDPSLTPLQPGEVINELHRQALGNRRCYERALKKDPFLEVKSIPVKITVDASGTVTSVVLGSHSSSVLGQCLIARLQQWAFRKSTKGISMNLTLTFEQQ